MHLITKEIQCTAPRLLTMGNRTYFFREFEAILGYTVKLNYYQTAFLE